MLDAKGVEASFYRKDPFLTYFENSTMYWKTVFIKLPECSELQRGAVGGGQNQEGGAGKRVLDAAENN